MHRKSAAFASIIALLFSTCCFTYMGCTKYAKGFLSPYIDYAVNQLVITRGRNSVSYTLNTDGSTTPMTVSWAHIYDSAGNIVDTLFTRKYATTIWTAAYDPTVDTTFALLTSLLGTDSLPAVYVNPSNGEITTYASTLNIPLGTYTMDIRITNPGGTETLSKLMSLTFVDGAFIETSPEQGNFRNNTLVAGTASTGPGFFNGPNNPFDSVVITRVAESPSQLVVVVTDKFGTPFNVANGELVKRPNAGLDPNPPFLPNLQDYSFGTYQASDTGFSVQFPIVPFPTAGQISTVSQGDGNNMYYRIPAQYVTIDSTSAWSANAAGTYYSGISDPHYLGQYVGGEYDYALRIPIEVFVPGSYVVYIKVLDITHL
jgi:hypothetical protein